MPAINKALEDVEGPMALHLCFGHTAVVGDKPSGYAFLTELEESVVDQIFIEAAQPGLDLSILKACTTKTVILGVLDLGNMTIETPEGIAARIREALEVIPPERLMLAPDCGMKYLDQLY